MTDPDLFSLLYHSRERLPADPAQAGLALSQILAAAQRNNRRDGLTGVLMFGHGSFVQVLEGPPAQVRAAFARVLADPRHEDVALLSMGRVDKRTFSDWSMAAIRDWDLSPRAQQALDAAGLCEGPGPSPTTLLNVMLSVMMRQVGRPWPPAEDRRG